MRRFAKFVAHVKAGNPKEGVVDVDEEQIRSPSQASRLVNYHRKDDIRRANSDQREPKNTDFSAYIWYECQMYGIDGQYSCHQPAHDVEDKVGDDVG
mmetsp:Transcript_17905/g.43828  ORF Transcript_17905/g.43828 Transcript_17905/m.43828 type:complete len:97 (-) Transcript_17905:23-313(-)